MECQQVEEHLIDYLDRSLPREAMARMAEHMRKCTRCPDLLEQVRSLVVTCKTLPALDPGVDLVEKILLRTSGRPRTRTFQELVAQFFLRPILTPRFAAGSALVVLFLTLTFNLMWPKVSAVASVLSPREMLWQMDRATQRIYSEGLKIYDKKNEWQAEFTFLKNNMFNRLGFMIEQLDVPVQGKEKSEEPGQPEKAPNDKSSVLLLPA